MVNFLFALIELILLPLRLQSYKAKCLQFSCFRREDRCLWTQILPGQCRPASTILGIRKLETMDYPTVKTASLCVPLF